MVVIVRLPEAGRPTGDSIDSLNSGTTSGHVCHKFREPKPSSLAQYILPSWQTEAAMTALEVWVP